MWFFKSQKAASEQSALEMRTLVEQLDTLGFYACSRADDVPLLKDEALKTRWLFGAPRLAPAETDDPETDLEPSSNRSFYADAEDLAEGEVGHFLDEIKPFLEQQGVRLPRVTEHFAVGGGYTIQIGSDVTTLYTADELDDGIWQLTTARAFEAVNRLLAAAGSRERVYAIFGGNDQQAVFLTAEQFGAIAQSPALEAREKPYRAADELPDAGEPD